jgi:hypothetical protein
MLANRQVIDAVAGYAGVDHIAVDVAAEPETAFVDGRNS